MRGFVKFLHTKWRICGCTSRWVHSFLYIMGGLVDCRLAVRTLYAEWELKCSLFSGTKQVYLGQAGRAFLIGVLHIALVACSMLFIMPTFRAPWSISSLTCSMSCALDAGLGIGSGKFAHHLSLNSWIDSPFVTCQHMLSNSHCLHCCNTVHNFELCNFVVDSSNEHLGKYLDFKIITHRASGSLDAIQSSRTSYGLLFPSVESQNHLLLSDF